MFSGNCHIFLPPPEIKCAHPTSHDQTSGSQCGVRVIVIIIMIRCQLVWLVCACRRLPAWQEAEEETLGAGARAKRAAQKWLKATKSTTSENAKSRGALLCWLAYCHAWMHDKLNGLLLPFAGGMVWSHWQKCNASDIGLAWKDRFRRKRKVALSGLCETKQELASRLSSRPPRAAVISLGSGA